MFCWCYGKTPEVFLALLATTTSANATTTSANANATTANAATTNANATTTSVLVFRRLRQMLNAFLEQFGRDLIAAASLNLREFRTFNYRIPNIARKAVHPVLGKREKLIHVKCRAIWCIE